MTGQNRKIASPWLIMLQSFVDKRELQLLVVGNALPWHMGKGKKESYSGSKAPENA